MLNMKDDSQLEHPFSASNLMSSSFGNTTPERDSNSVSDQSLSSSQSPSSSDETPPLRSSEESESVTVRNHNKKNERKANSFAYRIREHVRLGPKFSETVKGKLSVGAKIIMKGGRENIFKDVFGVTDGEKLLKASQCYLSTSTGPIAGILFISTEKVAFCSERSITLHFSSGALIRTLYKVSVPVKKIKEATESQNANNPAQKYIQIVTKDNFEFWFMGFVRYEKAFSNLEKAISLY